jgi:eukaryotic-like serine/threonine-protein kinase
VHRDVKPQNILIDQDKRVYLVDFGLALADQDIGKRLPAGGTPAYMSPEQARNEGHRRWYATL